MTKKQATLELLDAYQAEGENAKERDFRRVMRRYDYKDIYNRNYTERVIDIYEQWKAGSLTATCCVQKLIHGW